MEKPTVHLQKEENGGKLGGRIYKRVKTGRRLRKQEVLGLGRASERVEMASCLIKKTSGSLSSSLLLKSEPAFKIDQVP